MFTAQFRTAALPNNEEKSIMHTVGFQQLDCTTNHAWHVNVHATHALKLPQPSPDLQNSSLPTVAAIMKLTEPAQQGVFV